MAIVRTLSTPLSVAVLCALLTSSASGQGFYPRGDATCSAVISAADLVATARGLGGSSSCTNDDCDRDGVVTPADLRCVPGCLFDACPVPEHAARVTSIAPDGAPAVAPSSVVRIAVDNLGSPDAIKRVTIGGLEAEVIEQEDGALLVALPAALLTGPAEVVVFDGDLAGAPFSIEVAPAVPLGAPDTLDGTLELIDGLLAALLTLDLEGVYGESTALLRQEIERARTELAAERAALASDSTLSEADRLHLDAAFEASGAPEMLRAQIAEIEATAGLEVDGVTATALDTARLIRGAAKTIKIARAVAATAAATAAGTLTAPIAAGIAAGTAIVAGSLVFAAGDPLTPLIFSATYADAENDDKRYPTAGGFVTIRGARFDTITTALDIKTSGGDFRVTDSMAGNDEIVYRLPNAVGFCGAATLTLVRSAAEFRSNPVTTRVQPELLRLPNSIKAGAVAEGDARGTSACHADAILQGSTEPKPAVGYPVPGKVSFYVPAVLPDLYRVGLMVQGVRSVVEEDILMEVTDPVTGLLVTCAPSIVVPDRLPSGPGLIVAPLTFVPICVAELQPSGVVRPKPSRFTWRSSRGSTATVQATTTEPQTAVTARDIGTVTISAALEGIRNPAVTLATGVSEPVTVLDNAKPRIGITSMTTSPVSPGGSIVVTATATDNTKLTQLRLTASGDAVASGGAQETLECVGQKSCSATFTVTLKESGFTQTTVTVQAEALDAGANAASSNTLSFSIAKDDACPVITFEQPVNGSTVNAGEQVLVVAVARDVQPGDTGVKRLTGTAGGPALVAPASVEVPLPLPLPSSQLRFPFTVKQAADLGEVEDKTIVITVDAFDAAMPENHCPQTITVNVIGVLDGCSGFIDVDNRSGYIGDAFTITVTLTGAGVDEITRVTSINPGGTFDLVSQGGGIYTKTLFYQGTGSFTLQFVAFNAAGVESCSGSTSLESLGPREEAPGAFLQRRGEPAGAGLR